MRKYTIVPALLLVFTFSCVTKKNKQAALERRIADSIAAEEMYYVDTEGDDQAVNFTEEEPPKVYRPSKTRLNDIQHTRLEISLNWEKQYAYGKATLWIKPYFYPTNNLKLDAQGFDLKRVAMINGKDTSDLLFGYDKKIIDIALPREYARTETYVIFVDYTAKPEELENAGSSAITDAKGMYFINPLGKDTTNPTQMWTQGETQSSSCWFPTIDAPNEKITQEIFVTVAKKYQTISNGKLVSQKQNADGTRTDHWKQDKPHAPYLAALVAGEFVEIKDKWRNIPVSYFVDKKYESSAKTIFGNTPKMMEFFSGVLRYNYPWDKYDQVVVNEFVSGAMENTTCTIHGDMLKLDTRELLDHEYEDVIAHELFHHWFGDLVTTESWSNLPLNESFATYSEYLWKEFAYGREEADLQLLNDHQAYFGEAEQKQVDLVRFHYDSQEDMFDRHSYQKGGSVLHMLRKHVGDSAFFQSLNLYLTQNAYKAAEMHHLRLAFEEVTGEDLNWFFNQWFYASGHPKLEIMHNYDTESGQYTISVSQSQDLTTTPLYLLPVQVDFHFADSVYSTQINISQAYETFNFDLKGKPLWVSFDAEKMLLAQKNEEKDATDWMYQLSNGKVLVDKLEALTQIEAMEDVILKKQAITLAMNDAHWKIRERGMELIKGLPEPDRVEFTEPLSRVARNDKKSLTRVAALDVLGEMRNPELAPLFLQSTNDSSYSVVATALGALAGADSNLALKTAAAFTGYENFSVRLTSLYILAQYSNDDLTPLFEKEIISAGSTLKFYLVPTYGQYLLRQSDHNLVVKGLRVINNITPANENDYLIAYVINAVNGELEEKYDALAISTEAALARTKNDTEKASLTEELRRINKVKENIKTF